MRVSVTGGAAIRRRVSPRVHYTMKRESGDKRLECRELAVGKASIKCVCQGYATNRREIPRLRRPTPSQERRREKRRSAPLGMTNLGMGGNQFFGAMNQFYKYDKGGVGAYNLAHPKPAVDARRCLTSDEHCEVSTVVYGLL